MSWGLGLLIMHRGHHTQKPPDPKSFTKEGWQLPQYGCLLKNNPLTPIGHEELVFKAWSFA
jgi:hypothetical protein